MNSLAKIDRLNFNVDDLNIFPDININKMAMMMVIIKVMVMIVIKKCERMITKMFKCCCSVPG